MQAFLKGQVKQMTGGTRKRGSTWSYYFDLGKVDGKRQKKEKGGFKTKKEAEAALAKAISEYNNCGAIFEPSEITVADFLDQWYDLYCKPNLKYNTQVNYLYTIKNHLKPQFGQYRLKALTPAVLQEYANGLKLEGYSRGHITSMLAMFRTALDYAVEPLQYLSSNPMRYVKFPKVERGPRQRVVLTLEQWGQIMERFPAASRYHVPLMLGFYCGLRISETVALTWDDIDFQARTITVNKQVVKRKGGADVRKAVESPEDRPEPAAWYFGSTKTASSQRVIHFGDTLYKALKAERAAQMSNELRRGESYIVHLLEKATDEKGNDLYKLVPAPKGMKSDLPRVPLVCVAASGAYTSSDSCKSVAKIVHHELGFPFDYHSLRHTHATLLIESGADVKDVQERLGHGNIKTTLQNYVHNTDTMKNRSVEIFEQAVARKSS